MRPVRVQAETWEAEVSAVPRGALRREHGQGPPPGYAMVLVLTEVPELNGLYFVPRAELLPPQERERAKRAEARSAIRAAQPVPQPLALENLTFGNGIAWPKPGPDGWTLHGGPLDLSTPAPAPADCERARLLLAGLEDLSVADARRACDLRYFLKQASAEGPSRRRRVLRDVLLFLGGVHPAQPGQAALVCDLLRLVGPPEKTRAAPLALH